MIQFLYSRTFARTHVLLSFLLFPFLNRKEKGGIFEFFLTLFTSRAHRPRITRERKRIAKAARRADRERETTKKRIPKKKRRFCGLYSLLRATERDLLIVVSKDIYSDCAHVSIYEIQCARMYLRLARFGVLLPVFARWRALGDGHPDVVFHLSQRGRAFVAIGRGS